MKKLFFTLLISLICISVIQAQQTKYAVFEFFKVESGQVYDFIEFKNFKEKVLRAAANDKKIIGWDFWSIQSGADAGEFQYITVTHYDDPVKMMKGLSEEEMIKYALVAFPHLNDKQIRTIYENSLGTRDLAQRTYMEEIATTKDNYQLKKGSLASFDIMKAVEGRFNEYEKAEREVFLPIHQKRINQGLMASWSLYRTALPLGSEATSTHLTLNVYDDYLQFFNSQQYEDMGASPEQRAAEERGLKSRDQKWVYLATLENVIR